MASSLTARCSCGAVELQATGAPIVSVVCHCNDCQAAALQIEALPNASRVCEPEGGVAYLAYRKDRIRIQKGAELLRAFKIRPKSATNRMVAMCCHSAMVLTFDDKRHWVDVYRQRLIGEIPPLQMQLCTKYRQKETINPTVPAFSKYPFRLVVRLLAAKLAMLVGA